MNHPDEPAQLRRWCHSFEHIVIAYANYVMNFRDRNLLPNDELQLAAGVPQAESR